MIDKFREVEDPKLKLPLLPYESSENEEGLTPPLRQQSSVKEQTSDVSFSPRSRGKSIMKKEFEIVQEEEEKPVIELMPVEKNAAAAAADGP